MEVQRGRSEGRNPVGTQVAGGALRVRVPTPYFNRRPYAHARTHAPRSSAPRSRVPSDNSIQGQGDPMARQKHPQNPIYNTSLCRAWRPPSKFRHRPTDRPTDRPTYIWTMESAGIRHTLRKCRRCPTDDEHQHQCIVIRMMDSVVPALRWRCYGPSSSWAENPGPARQDRSDNAPRAKRCGYKCRARVLA